MRALSLSVLLAVLLVSAPAEGAAQTNLAGDWILTIGTPPGDPAGNGHWVYVDRRGRTCLWPSRPMLYHITVTQDGQALTATGVTGASGPFEINGSVDETGVRLLWERGSGRPCGSVDFRFTGRVVENSMSGSDEVGDTFQSEWSATRTRAP